MTILSHLSASSLFASAALLAATACKNGERNTQKVMVGEVQHEDACLGVGKLMTATKVGVAEIAVRNRPSRNATIVSVLKVDQYFWICDASDDGLWTGVLFSHRSDGRIACGVSAPLERHIPYEGPCKQGWLLSEFVSVYAG